MGVVASAPPADDDAPGAATPDTAGSPTTTCSPSVRGRARFRPAREATCRAPPAARTASTTRAPVGNVTIPGRLTLPVTSTASVPLGELGAAEPGSGGEDVEDSPSGDTSAAGEEGGPEATGDTSVPVPSPAWASHQPVSPSAASTSRATSPRWDGASRIRPWRVGGSRSWAHPDSEPTVPTERCACRPAPDGPTTVGRGRSCAVVTASSVSSPDPP